MLAKREVTVIRMPMPDVQDDPGLKAALRWRALYEAMDRLCVAVEAFAAFHDDPKVEAAWVELETVHDRFAGIVSDAVDAAIAQRATTPAGVLAMLHLLGENMERHNHYEIMSSILDSAETVFRRDCERSPRLTMVALKERFRHAA